MIDGEEIDKNIISQQIKPKKNWIYIFVYLYVYELNFILLNKYLTKNFYK